MPIPDGERVKIACVKCQKEFEGVMPKCEIMDLETVTILAWAHPTREVCPYCGQAHQMRIINLQGFALDYVGVKTKGEPIIVTGPEKLM